MGLTCNRVHYGSPEDEEWFQLYYDAGGSLITKSPLHSVEESDTAVDVANSFFSNLFKHHGMPDGIVSDRDPEFTSKFWNRLMDLWGVKLKMSSSRHPQTDGASEVMNRMVENYLRCYVHIIRMIGIQLCDQR